MRVTTVHVSCPSIATLHGGAFAATTVHVARNSVTTVHGGKFSLAPLQPGASDISAVERCEGRALNDAADARCPQHHVRPFSTDSNIP